jgi:hypothetical protein
MLRFLHALGLTNLTDEELEKYYEKLHAYKNAPGWRTKWHPGSLAPFVTPFAFLATMFVLLKGVDSRDAALSRVQAELLAANKRADNLETELQKVTSSYPIMITNLQVADRKAESTVQELFARLQAANARIEDLNQKNSKILAAASETERLTMRLEGDLREGIRTRIHEALGGEIRESVRREAGEGVKLEVRTVIRNEVQSELYNKIGEYLRRGEGMDLLRAQGVVFNRDLREILRAAPRPMIAEISLVPFGVIQGSGPHLREINVPPDTTGVIAIVTESDGASRPMAGDAVVTTHETIFSPGKPNGCKVRFSSTYAQISYVATVIRFSPDKS